MFFTSGCSCQDLISSASGSTINHHVFSQDDFMLSLHVLHSVQLHTAIKASLCMSAILALLSTLFYPNLSSLNRYNEQAKRRSGLLES